MDLQPPFLARNISFVLLAHVETLVVLSHKKPDGHINVKVEFGEEDGQVSLKEVAKRAEQRKLKKSYLKMS
ncbi:MAG: hypothetical protein PUB81_03105 [Clostridiales bacterium]|nr:hypothetical protein [Clostridiales bacterium]MDD6054312.1 hypothetical protein [Clostridiales bacterium]